jgi:hypothetical protein
MLGANILQLSVSLKSCFFINDIQKWYTINIHNINHN